MAEDIYFPPKINDNWQTLSLESIDWDSSQLNQLFDFLDSKNTKAFIVLKNGKIVIEKYFDSFTKDSNWYWASAGKTLTSNLIGIAQSEGLLDINDKSSKYLGNNWTSLSDEKEDLISIKNQITMTSGLDDKVENSDCTEKTCLVYKSDAGTRWAYHNAPYTLLDKVIESATGKNLNTYFSEKIKSKIGMNGLWAKLDYNNVYFSTPRSMARYGLLMLAEGKWDGNTVISDMTYFNDMKSTSQNLNKSYGYLWWLNGKESYMIPQVQFVFKGMLFPDAPSDVFAALGKNGQCLSISPSTGIVVVRMGDAPGSTIEDVSTEFNNEIWKRLNKVMKVNSIEYEEEISSDFQIIPNPSNEFIKIQNAENMDVTFFDAIGLQVLNIKNYNGELIDIDNLASGVYTISIGNKLKQFVKN